MDFVFLSAMSIMLTKKKKSPSSQIQLSLKQSLLNFCFPFFFEKKEHWYCMQNTSQFNELQLLDADKYIKIIGKECYSFSHFSCYLRVPSRK